MWRRWCGRSRSADGGGARVWRASRRDALRLDHIRGDTQQHLPVDRTAAPGELPIVLLDGDLVTEEPRRAGARVGDQGLVLRHLQLEILTQKRREALLDLLGLGFRSGEPEQGVVLSLIHI